MRPNTTNLAPLDRILVVKLADLGDAILATSAIRALRTTYPQARIDVLTAGAGAVAFGLCSDIDEIITIDKHAFDHPVGLADPRNSARLLGMTARLRRKRYDAIVLLHHLTTRFGALKFQWLCRTIGSPIRAGLDNGRGRFLTHRAVDYGFGARSVHDYGLDVVGTLQAHTGSAQPALAIAPDVVQEAREKLRAAGAKPNYVVIHPSVGDYSMARNWFPERFAAVARALVERFDIAIVLVGADDASRAAAEIRPLAPVVDLTGKTSFAELAAIVGDARLVIGADSGVVHLAAALGAPTLAIFGPSNAPAWKPFGAQIVDIGSPELPPGRSFALRAELPCAPCFYTGYGLGRHDGCALRTCLRLITAEKVAHFAIAILARNDAPQSTTP